MIITRSTLYWALSLPSRVNNLNKPKNRNHYFYLFFVLSNILSCGIVFPFFRKSCIHKKTYLVFTMTSAEDVNHWLEAFQSFDHSQYDDAIVKFQSLNPTAKIMFNIGCCFLSSEDYTRALQVSGYIHQSHKSLSDYLKYIDLGPV